MDALRDGGPRATSALDAVGVGSAVPRHLRRHADALRRQRGGPGVARARRAPGHGPLAPGRREAPADAVEPARRCVDPTTRCSPGSATRPWVYFVHSLHGVPDDPAVVAATCDYGGPVDAAFRRGQRVRHAVPPGEVGARRARACSATSSTVAAGARDRVMRAVPGDRPARRAGRAARARATTTRETVYGDDPVAVAPGVRRRRARRGSTSSTSTPPARGEPVNRPVVAAIAARGRRARQRADRRRRAHASTTPRRWPTPASPGS